MNKRGLTVGEEIVRIKTDLTYIKQGIDDIKENLKEVPKIYATKAELNNLQKQTNDNSKWIVKYGRDLAYLSAFVLLFAKTQGWL